MKLNIDDEFKSLIPPLTNEEFEELEQSIITDGCRDAIVVWRTKGNTKTTGNGSVTMDTIIDTIIDGHNRHRICTAHGKDYKTYPMWFETRDDVRAWIIKNQFARRNLDKVQRSRLALTLKNLYTAKGKKNQVKSGIEYGKGCQKSDEPIIEIDTKKELAKIAGVSHDTIHKVETVDNYAPEPIKQAMADSSLSIHKAYEVTRAIQSLPEPQQKELVEELDNASGEVERTKIIERINPTINAPVAEPPTEKICKKCGTEMHISNFTEGRNICNLCRNQYSRDRNLKDFRGIHYTIDEATDKEVSERLVEVFESMYDKDREIVFTTEVLLMDLQCITDSYVSNLARCGEEYDTACSYEEKQKIVSIIAEAETAIQKIKGVFSL